MAGTLRRQAGIRSASAGARFGEPAADLAPGRITAGQQRQVLRFSAVNRQGNPGHDPGLQRHHLLPLQLLSTRCFSRFFEAIGLERVGFDDFRRNGLLLPCSDRTAVLMALPMHRGPHHRYNELAMERVARIERQWQIQGCRDLAATEALFRISLLQGALRRRLLDPGRQPIPLNRRDPAMRAPDFSDLEAMADALWAATENV